MKTTVQTSRGPVRFHSVGEPIAGIPATNPTAAHTPGPWYVENQHPANLPSGFGGSMLVLTPCGRVEQFGDTAARREANARLIASAPDLLAALEALAREYVALVDDAVAMPAYIQARAAIARAKGVQS